MTLTPEREAEIREATKRRGAAVDGRLVVSTLPWSDMEDIFAEIDRLRVEVERLMAEGAESRLEAVLTYAEDFDRLDAERALADGLAEALRRCYAFIATSHQPLAFGALARYDERRKA